MTDLSAVLSTLILGWIRYPGQVSVFLRRFAMTFKRFADRDAYFIVGIALLCLVALTGVSSCGGDDGGGGRTNPSLPAIVVNSLLDDASPPSGTVTLRSALASASSGQQITFDPSLDGSMINLIFVDAEHTVLIGEVMGFDDVNNISYLVGYFDRDYGKSALYADKNVFIDASNLPAGITINWDGADSARVLAVAGHLTLNNVAITGGNSVFDVAEDVGQHPDDDQTSTLARGAGLAVWGVATLTDCTIYDNHAVGDSADSSRDGGAYGGGVYADTVEMDNCIVSGNTVSGGGAAGGGVFSVGGRDSGENVSVISQSAITENRIAGLFAYGGGVYSDGGGIGMSTRIHVENSTIARNLVEPPALPPFLFDLLDIGYWRGGGLYMSNGHMRIQSSTIAENQVFGKPRNSELYKPNMAGGIAATIGNAHAVEDMVIGHSIIVGNTVHEIDGLGPDGYTIGNVYPHDVFTGSVFYFRSMGYNRIGVIDFSQILVPVGEPGWASLSRKHYPQADDQDGVVPGDVLGSETLSTLISSAGVGADPFAVLNYEPAGNALDQVPGGNYNVTEVLGALVGSQNEGRNPRLLPLILNRFQDVYGQADFESEFRGYFEEFLLDVDPDTAGSQRYFNCNNLTVDTLEQAYWCGPGQTWPAEDHNFAYIEFWRRLDWALADELAEVNVDQITNLGPALMNDDVWVSLFGLGNSQFNGITVNLNESTVVVSPLDTDQLGNPRPSDLLGDIGAVEIDN
ncbi:MAG: hypothetical protein DRR11_13735 [Gammaproteobacteria bacterium]|nr:MAG: hypothetical protein DRR11_13735 [Gammaproteobacteria bacterium]